MRTNSTARLRWAGSARRRSIVAAPRLERLEVRQLLTIYPVTQTIDAVVPGTLRWAIEQANKGPGGDTIAFAIPGDGVKTINLTAALPAITVPVVIDGTTQPSYAGTPVIQLDGTGAGPGVNGLSVLAGSTTIAGLSIIHFQGDAIQLVGAGQNVIRSNQLGVGADGSTSGSNGAHGIYVNSSGNTIGGPEFGQGNVISSNVGYGILIDAGSGNVIQGNLVGVDGSGSVKRGNQAGGILVKNGLGNLIGGSSGYAGNVISGNGAHGIETFGLTDGLLVEGNSIGTDRAHGLNLGNRLDGVHLFSSNNTIGGTAPGAGNTIAYNGDVSNGSGSGVGLVLNSQRNQILSNSIFFNVGLGINLGGSGNQGQQAPILSAGSTDSSSTVVSGSLTGSRPDTAYVLQFFANTIPDDLGFGEGAVYLGTLRVTTDHAGNFAFSTSLTGGVPPGAFISATATDASGNTSQFSRNVPTKGTADVGVSLTATPSNPQVGDLVTYTLTVSNSGPTVARGVQAVQLLPAGVTLVSASSLDAQSIPGTGQVTFNFGELQVGESRTATVIVRTSAASGTILSSSATVTTFEGDPNAGNNAASISIPLSPLTDLSVTMEGWPGSVPLGQNVTYSVIVTNLGPSAATNVRLTDILPNNVTLVSASSSQGSTTIQGSVITTLITSLAANSAPVVLTIVVSTNATTSSSIVNQAAVIANEAESSTENNSASITTEITRVADLKIVIPTVPGPVLSGQPFTYTVILTNQGPSIATGISLVDVLPAGVSMISASDNVGGNLTFADGVLTDEIASLESGGVVVLKIVVLPTTPTAAVLLNSATVTSLVADPDLSNNSASVSTLLNPAADLAVVFTTAPAAVGAGDSLVYTITVTNNGPSAATGVTLVDLLPANAKVTSVIVSQGDSTQTPGQVIGKFGTLAAGGIATMTIVIQTAVSDAPSILSTATVSSNEVDLRPEDNATAVSTMITPRTDLAVTITPLGGPLLLNRSFTYVITVTNQGPSVATEVTLTQVLPVGLSFVSASNRLGAGLRPVDGRLIDLIGDLASGQSATLTVVVTTIATGPITMSASVVGHETDDNLANNVATVASSIVPVADLSVKVATDRAVVTTGDHWTYTLTVTNQGPSSATGVILNESLGSGQSIVSLWASQGSLGRDERGGITAQIGELAAGASATVKIVVMSGVAGPGINRATVSALEFDPDPSGNAATVNVQVLEPPGTFQFAASSVTVNENAGTATVVVNRTGGSQGRVSVNYFTVLAGTARPGVDFIPVSGTLVFNHGEVSKSFTVPVLANPHSKQDGTVNLVLRGPQGGASLGAQIATTLVVHDIDPDFAGPRIDEIRMFGPATSIQYLNLFFNEELNPATAMSPDGYRLFDVGPDGRFGTADDRQVPLLPPGYDPAYRVVTLMPVTPLMANRSYYVQATGMEDLAGNRLDPGVRGLADDQFGAYLFRGTSLKYTDSHQTVVTLGVTGGGLFSLTRFGNGDGDRLQVLNPQPQRTVLSGRVRGGTRSTTFTSITGLGDFGQVRIMMNSPTILVGNLPFNRRFISPPAVDGVFKTAGASGKLQARRFGRPKF